MLDYFCGSGITSNLTGYLIHSHWYSSTEPTSSFWEIQFNIMHQLCIIWLLSIVVAFVHPDQDCHAASQSFVNQLSDDGWIVTDAPISFHDFGDSFAGLCQLIIAVHLNTKAKCKPFTLITLPSVPSRPIGCFTWAPFNTPGHAISFSKDNLSFNLQAVNENSAPPLQVSIPTPCQHALLTSRVHVAHYLHCQQDNPNVLPGS
jgi:hypothetical protein